jgi:two-component system, NarL family, sensor kinase
LGVVAIETAAIGERVHPEPGPGAVGPGIFGDQIPTTRLVLRYAVTGLITLVIVAVGTAWASRARGTQEAIIDATNATTLAAGVAVEPMLSDGVLSGDPVAIAALDDIVRRVVLRGSLVRVKMWDETGKIVYSDEPRLIGRQFGLREDEREALQTNLPKAELSDLSDPENVYEEPAVELLEVYLPVHTPSGAPVLFEAYFRYAGVTEAGRAVWLRFAPLSLGALVLLELLQVPIALALARRLRRAQSQREQLYRRAMEATDGERRRIASDLHDGVVQDLAGVAFSLGATARRLAAQRGEPEPSISDAADRVRQAVRGLRSLLVEIYPPNLYEEGLEAALSDLLARLAPRNIATSLDVDVATGLGVEVTELLYRVAQEGVRNVVEHADAGRVEISVSQDADTTVLCVVDDGRGLDDAAIPARPGHLGLRALAGLAESLGATLSIESQPGQGTALRLEVPIQ